MENIVPIAERRTSADVVFDYLYQEIATLRLLPGAKISEADIATRFGISRQPVRDAFSRLGNLDLLLIRPQKATEVRRFSSQGITQARFVRAAVEAEVLRRAASEWDADDKTALEGCLKDQERTIKANDYEAFHALDYSFHKMLCVAAKVPFAFDTITENKAKVDRLCVLSLTRTARMDELLEDHTEMVHLLLDRNAQGLVDAGMLHLSRLDSTLERIQGSHADYFED